MLHDATYALHNKTVDRFNREKLYIQLMRIFLEEISTGKWRLEEKIPSEDELCKKYHVSKITVRQAINNLSSDGYLMKIQGKGTFVTSAIPVVGLAMKTRFTEEMFGQEVQLTKELLIKGITEPPTEVKAYLKTDDRIYQFLCRRMANSNPAYLDTVGWVYYSSGDYAAAVPYLERAAQGLAQVPVVQYHLGAALAKQGDTAAARRHLQEALRRQVEFPGADDAQAILNGLRTKRAP